MAAEKVAINLKGDKMAVLTIQSFDGEIDVEDLLKIDYSNILGEILTFPVVFNRIANLRAEAAHELAMMKFSKDALEAQLYEKHKNSLTASGSKGSIKDVEMAVNRDRVFKLKMESLNQAQKNFDYCDALYWSAQSKDKKLDKLTDRMKPEDFETELLEGTINGVQIKLRKKAIV